MAKRPFRTPESHAAERQARGLVPIFLERRGFAIESDQLERQGQTIVAVSPNGQRLAMRVKLCWRRDGRRESQRSRAYSAAQLMARIKNDDWIGSIENRVQRERERGVTHFLFVQPEGADIALAAALPVAALLPVWVAQRDIS